MVKNDGSQGREQEAQPQGEGIPGKEAEEMRREELVAEAARQAKLAAESAEMLDMKVGCELQLAGVKNVKAAKAQLDDRKGCIAARRKPSLGLSRSLLSLKPLPAKLLQPTPAQLLMRGRSQALAEACSLDDEEK